MQESEVTRVKRILSKLRRINQPAIRVAKLYYPYRKWSLLRRIFINEKFTIEDLEAWEVAIDNYKNRRIREKKTCKRNREIETDSA